MTAPIFFLLNILRFFLSIFPKFLHFPVAFHQLSVFHSSTSFFYITYFFLLFPIFHFFFFTFISLSSFPSIISFFLSNFVCLLNYFVFPPLYVFISSLFSFAPLRAHFSPSSASTRVYNYRFTAAHTSPCHDKQARGKGMEILPLSEYSFRQD